jgi:hypothetical protein
MITIKLGHPDRSTEIKILHSRSGLEEEESSYIVDIIRELRGDEHKSKTSLRAGIAIAKVIGQQGIKPRHGDRLFHSICYDTLSMETAKIQHAGRSIFYEMVDDVICKVCPPLENESKNQIHSRKIKVVE